MNGIDLSNFDPVTSSLEDLADTLTSATREKIQEVESKIVRLQETKSTLEKKLQKLEVWGDSIPREELEPEEEDIIDASHLGSLFHEIAYILEDGPSRVRDMLYALEGTEYISQENKADDKQAIRCRIVGWHNAGYLERVEWGIYRRPSNLRIR